MPTARLFDRPQDYLFRQPVPPPPPPPPPVKPPPPFTRQDQFDAEMVGGIGSYRPQTGASLSDIAGDMTEGGQDLVTGGQSIWGIPLPTSIKASPIDLGNGYRLVAVVKPAVLNQSGQVLIPARLDWEMVASIPPLKQPAPQEINPGNSLVDPTTGKVIYTAPSKPSKLEQGKVLVDDPAHPGGYLEVWSINGNPQRNAITGRYAQIFRTIPPPASLREAPPSRNYEKWNPATKTHDTIIEKWNPTTSTWEVDKVLAGKPAPAEAPPRLAPKKIPNNYVVGGEVEVYSEWDNQAKQWVYDYEGADKRAKQIADDINKQARQSTIDNAALVTQQQAIIQGQKDLGENTQKTADLFRTLNFLKAFPTTGQQSYPEFLAQLPQGGNLPEWLTAGGEELWNAPTGANWIVNEARRQGLLPSTQGSALARPTTGSGTAQDPWRNQRIPSNAPPDVQFLNETLPGGTVYERQRRINAQNANAAAMAPWYKAMDAERLRKKEEKERQERWPSMVQAGKRGPYKQV